MKRVALIAVAADEPKGAATPPAVVEAVQVPAWVERVGLRFPLTPGMTVQSDDDLRIGANARLLLKLAEDSAVKLGENMQLFYIAPKGRPALPVQLVDADQLKQWAEGTEIEAGKRAARRGGRWKAVLASGESESDVLCVYQDVRAAGDAAELDPEPPQGRRAYEVRIAQLPSRAEADALAVSLSGRVGVSAPRVTQ